MCGGCGDYAGYLWYKELNYSRLGDYSMDFFGGIPTVNKICIRCAKMKQLRHDSATMLG